MEKLYKDLYNRIDFIAKTAKRGFITLSECNHEMEKEIDMFFAEYWDYDEKIKAYNKMYELLFNLSKFKIKIGD